jgi:cyclic dehypoxanthinyl futalosine synthase
MELAHQEGMKTSVTMMYGIGETLAERIEHLERVRALQARTGGFTAFITWPLQPENTPTMSHYLRTVAIARIVLDNVPNLQSSWVTMGMKVGQLALRFGCNDFGSLMIEENVVSAAGTTHRTTTDELGAAARTTPSSGNRKRSRPEDRVAAEPVRRTPQPCPTLPSHESRVTSHGRLVTKPDWESGTTRTASLPAVP